MEPIFCFTTINTPQNTDRASKYGPRWLAEWEGGRGGRTTYPSSLTLTTHTHTLTTHTRTLPTTHLYTIHHSKAINTPQDTDNADNMNESWVNQRKNSEIGQYSYISLLLDQILNDCFHIHPSPATTCRLASRSPSTPQKPMKFSFQDIVFISQ